MADSDSLSSDEEYDIPTNMFVDVTSDMFVGRHSEMKRLEEQLLHERIAAISGIGGVGKTTFSCLYAFNNRRKYRNGIFFVDASGLKNLPFKFAEIAGPDVLGLTKVEDSDQNKMKLASNWLRNNRDYLLMYDAADDPSILQELFSSELENGVRFIPDKDTLRGHVLITSRCPDEQFQQQGISAAIYLDDLSVEETCEFLWKRVAGDGDVPESELPILRELAEETLFARLPLFLEQSGSYIRAENLSFSEYLSEIKQKKRERNPVRSASFGDNRQGLDERFCSNFDLLEKRNPNASMLLQLACICESRNIPLALFSCGAHLLQDCKLDLDKATQNFMEYVLQNTDMVSLEGSNKLMHIFKAGEPAVRELASLPWDTQLAILSKGSPDLTVHAVIQEQLRIQLNNHGKLNGVLKVAGWILHHMICLDDVPLDKKKLFLVHADKCADYIATFGNLKSPEKVVLELYIRLKLKTAYLFAWFGFFKTTWENLAEAERALPKEGVDYLWVEYLALKSRIHVWQIKSRDSMKVAKQGLVYYQKSLDLNSDSELTYTYAVLHKTCHHALIHEFRAFNADDSDVHMHLTEAKQTFEDLMKKGDRECDIEYGALLMHHGEYHMYKAYKLKNKFEICCELHQAKYWLDIAVLCLKPSTQIGRICRVLTIEVDLQIKCKTYKEAVVNLEEIRIESEELLGRDHRFVAWMVEKIADTHENHGNYEKCMQYLEDKLDRQKQIYNEVEGRLFFGETYHRMGRIFLKTSRHTEAERVLKLAERNLQETAETGRLGEVRALLVDIRKTPIDKD